MLKKIFAVGIQFTKFGLVGVLNTLIAWIIIFLGDKAFHFNYIPVNIVAYILGLINSFVWNKLWVFKSNKHPKHEILFFLLIFVISYGVNLLVTIALKESFSINKYIAQLVGMVFYTAINFFGNKFFTFKK